jgi:NAD(P)-dependent dehydrogenase (short-subunit alcohol dehydrogenase family)
MVQPKPVIGAITGAAVGIGATMTLPVDIGLASDRARGRLCVRPDRRGWDIATCAAFLASDEAEHITGQVIPVDGGPTVCCRGGTGRCPPF